jgi:hypothetical protein
MAIDPLNTILAAAEHLAKGDKDAAKARLALVAFVAPPAIAPRRLEIEDKLRAYARDQFTCVYCGQKLLATPVMRLLSVLDKDAFPYQVNWKVAECHPSYWALTPNAEHRVPQANGGADDDANIVTVCPKCHARKNGWDEKSVGMAYAKPTQAWDGGMSLLAPMAKAVGAAEEPWVREWLKAYEPLKGKA